MGTRDTLHVELLKHCSNAYFQPPSNLKMKYPCVVYQKSPSVNNFGNNHVYNKMQGYTLTVIDEDPDSEIADKIEAHFQYCSIGQYFVMDNLNHTTLNLYY